ncbi:MerR family transcriptional regulator [Pimelobacter simplex]|uniref:MerR family transcriptional regulator n=1 Tax=Nocardioides simplex TaxID=2045 RepID=UPI00214FEC01|nr:MerR family transcriptional regulator [Pimelobacter simplex]UUW91334.1 MerR family transcriptional regulator [Pimelobacter simplex]UUW95162.1 MerR family transcriptional regulator [Pimelobacter simplex]
MRISELADAAGVSVATLKYYQREGLLPPARKVAARLAEYDDTHLRRLRLLRVLREVGEVPVERLRSLVEAVEDADASVHDVFGVACDALHGAPPEPGPDLRAMADALIEQAGWDRVRPDSPDRDHLAALVGTILDLGGGQDESAQEGAATYLRLVDELARFEIGAFAGPDEADRDVLVERMVVGQVVYGELLLVLRRIAEEHYSAQRFTD